MQFTEMSCQQFADALASKASVPGGGGASALVAALGAALGTMVGNFTLGKKKYADVEADIRTLMEQAEDLRGRLLACIDADAAAFEPLSRAYGIPKEDPGRAEIMEKCLRDAAAAPLEILDLCCEAIELQREFADKGSVLAVSDAATGVVFCWSAMYGAAVNVKVNTKAMNDTEYAARINAHVDEQMARYWPGLRSTWGRRYLSGFSGLSVTYRRPRSTVVAPRLQSSNQSAASQPA